MSLQNCPRCGKLFNYVHRNLCPSCIAEEDQEFKRVREYLNNHPGAMVVEVSQATEVSEDKIMNFLRNGRLEVTEHSRLVLHCERCGVSIRSGKFCEACSTLLGRAFHQATGSAGKVNPPEVKEKQQKMHTADWFKKNR